MKRNQKAARIIVRIAGTALLIVAAAWLAMFFDFYSILSPRPRELTGFSYLWLLAVVLFGFAGVGLLTLKSWCRLPAMCIFGTIGGYITFVMFAFRSIIGLALMLPFVIGTLILFGTDWIKSAFKKQTIEDSQQPDGEPTQEAAQSATP